jgi:Flp pilus assembly protein TadG
MMRLSALTRRFRDDTSGIALLEFAICLPVLLTLSVTGAELTNYITVKMRVSQIALQIADNAARMGTGTATQAKMVSETDINDVFIGAQMESTAAAANSGLDLQSNGRVILSDLETKTVGATFYKIGWQRCYGNKTHASNYGTAGDTNLTGMGPAGRQVTAQDATPTMFVEVYYVYKPIFSAMVAPTTTLDEIASMSVRDRRDTSQIYNTANAPVASC